MHQKDHKIVERSNIQTDAIVVNQCDVDKVEEFDFVNNKGQLRHVKFISTKERGLSRSRNMAIRFAEDADICLVCDDDEFLTDTYESTILSAYHETPEADVIAFALDREDHPREFAKGKKILSTKGIMKTSSQQITFKRSSVLTKTIEFDVMMGSGTGNGGGEENMFLFTCKRKGLCMFYYPNVIAVIRKTGKSKWFNGFTERYFQNLGWVSRRIHGGLAGFAYILFWVLSHYEMYSKESTLMHSLKHLMIGFNERR